MVDKIIQAKSVASSVAFMWLWGTPGRVSDHIRKGTLTLDNLQALVLDEADEMLRMGFIDEVEWILEQTPEARQTALFSATMPKPIRKNCKTAPEKPTGSIDQGENCHR